jgi:parallel beta-helix repeat protein
MTITLKEKDIKRDYPNRKVTGQKFDDRVELKGVDGFEMIDCTFKYDNGGNESKVVLKLEDCKNIRLTECKFPKKDAHFSRDKSLDVIQLDENCKKITIKGCKFEGKTNKGNFIDIKDGFDIHIKDCHFKNHAFGGENGGEAILIGRGDNPDKSFDTHVIDCDFKNCNGDPELISIKQSKTEIVHNRFEDWDRGNVSIRFGGGNTIKDNTFKGSGGGILVRGRENKIIDNTHKDNRNNNDDYRPCMLENGKESRGYAKAVKNTISHNTYENCRGPCIILGQDDARDDDEIPKNNTFKNNIVKTDTVESSFLTVPEYRGNVEKRKRIIQENAFEDNELRGTRAKPGSLPLPPTAFKR